MQTGNPGVLRLWLVDKDNVIHPHRATAFDDDIELDASRDLARREGEPHPLSVPLGRATGRLGLSSDGGSCCRGASSELEIGLAVQAS